MTTQDYEERLEAFARGKRLRRFRGMIRNPKDPGCDACGSALPSFLWGLRDMDSEQDYFVGQSCLAAISRMHLIERPFVRAGIKEAFERARGEATAEESKNQAEVVAPTKDESPAVRAQWLDTTADARALDLRVYENDELVTVFVRMESPSGRLQAWGAASAPRQRRLWRADGEPTLSEVAETNDATLAACLRRAQRIATDELAAAAVSHGADDEAV